ncbi:hypothetical protein KEJ34_05235 [Candidatus Bathyarchaeota archaeon]|nr:hypothetical protein [Candidatus Bathyarchaeota archaeon]
MRMLILHIDYFNSIMTEGGQSGIVEDAPSKTTRVDDALLVLTSVEKQDENNPEDAAKKAVEEIPGSQNNSK